MDMEGRENIGADFEADVFTFRMLMLGVCCVDEGSIEI